MKKVKLLIILSFLTASLWSQDNVNINFSDSDNTKEVRVLYTINNLRNVFYEPYIDVIKSSGNKLSFSIPDVAPAFMLEIQSNGKTNWSKHMLIKMDHRDKIDIYLDSIEPPRFEGSHAELYNHLYSYKNNGGINRSIETEQAFLKYEKNSSFFNFIQEEIENALAPVEEMLRINIIDENLYSYAKDFLLDEYKFRIGLIGTNKEEKAYLQKIDSKSLYRDIDKLYNYYSEINNYPISLSGKAAIRANGYIPFEPIELGLNEINGRISYLSKEEQEIEAASTIITNLACGLLNVSQLNQQRNAFKKVFPESIHNTVLAQLEALDEKDHILAVYSKEEGFVNYGRFQATDFSPFHKMFFYDRPVLVDFWATWCGPCLKELEYKEELEAFLEDNNIGMLFVSIDYPGAYKRWKELIQTKKIEGMHYFGTDEFAENLVGLEIKQIPRYVLLGKEGEVLIEATELPSSGKLINQIVETLKISTK